MTDFIPYDKSYFIRCLCLDIIHRQDKFYSLLVNERMSSFNVDIQRAIIAFENQHSQNVINVGESATLYRFLKFINWKYNYNKQFVSEGTLTNRTICNDSSIVNWSIDQLLTLDDGTSQWASIAYMCGNKKIPKKVPFKLQTTIDVCTDYYNNKIHLKRDDTITYQLAHFTQNKISTFKPKQAEDYCFARAFNLITKEQGLKKWPQLVNHESNRIEEMEKQIDLLISKNKITSNDHRVIQALTLFTVKNNLKYKITNKKCVAKSWPAFWSFIKQYKATK